MIRININQSQSAPGSRTSLQSRLLTTGRGYLLYSRFPSLATIWLINSAVAETAMLIWFDVMSREK